ncbi:MAG: hypothetical protein KAV82_01265 [Phycisphaerae bacterium]|nr:hypothetical protein [Phycisphaerae bacterium]
MAVEPARLYRQLHLSDRLIVLVAWGLAIAIHFAIGWRVMQPLDPQGAVSMLSVRHPMLMMAQMAALSVVVAMLTTLLIGRKLADAGGFAVCVGIAVANLRGGTFEAILIDMSGSGLATAPGVGFTFLFEALVWFAVVVLAMVASGFVLRWCFGGEDEDGACGLSSMAVAEMPWVSKVLQVGDDDGLAASFRRGGRHTLFTAVSAFVLIGLLSAVTPARAITHGQVYFSILVAFYIAGYFAHGKFPQRTALWTCLAVPLVAVAAYLWAMLIGPGKTTGLPSTIPHSVYLRALPLEYVTLGTIGSMIAFWWTRQNYAARLLDRRKPRNTKKQM